MSSTRRRWMSRGTLAAAALLGLGMAGCRASSSPAVTPESPAAATPRNAPEQMGKPYVVMLSADGFRHDYVDRWTLPAVDRMQREGARAAGLVPSFPTKTFPNHYSIATGMYVGDHGLVGNEMWDPQWRARFLASRPADSGDARWFGGEPIWVTAERQGMLTATFFWPGSEAPIRGRRPTYWKAYDTAVPDSVRIDGMLGWLALPAPERPHLLLGYLSDVDDAAHKTGPVSPETHAGAQAIDVALARLRAGIARLPIRDSVNLILVSDHGLTEVRETEYLSRYTSLADTTAVVTAAAYAQLFFGGADAAAERAYAGLQRMPHARVWRRRDIPRRFHLRTNARAGDVFVLMEPPYRVERTPPAHPPTTPAAAMGGTHGYDPQHPDMPGIFFAVGPAIRPGVRVGPVENINVHPLIAHLLGIQPAEGIDGRLKPLRPILR